MKAPLARGMVSAMLILLLCACSSFRSQLPGGNGSISGTLLSDDYTLEIAALGDAMTLSASSVADPILRAPPARGAHVAGQVLVHYRSDAGDMSAQSLSSRRRTPRVIEVGPGEGLDEAISRLRRDPQVLMASPNYYIYPAALPDDPFLPQQWNLPAAGLPVTWDEPSGARVTVAVIDSGFDLAHVDLEGLFLPGYDFCGNSDCSASDANPGAADTSNWHGTHVAGIIAATGNNGEGVKGVADSSAVRILPVKVFNEAGGGGNTDVLIRAMRWAAGLPVDGAPVNSNPARIINLSLAGDFPAEVLQPTIDAVRAAGAVVIASTGNAGIGRVMSPAAAEGVIAVGAINSAFERSCFSNYGIGRNGPGGVDLVAPGGEADGSLVSCGLTSYDFEGLMSTIPGDGYGSAVGTSMAAPMVSGVAAMILGRDPTLDVTGLEAKLRSSAYFDPSYMTETEYGAGILRADSALGYSGPGDPVLVELTEAESGWVRRLPLTLGLSAAGVEFSFEGIEPGSYELRAEDPGSGLVFTSQEVTLSPGEQLRTELVMRPGS